MAVILSTNMDDQACLSLPLSKSRYASLSLLRIFTLVFDKGAREKIVRIASSVSQTEGHPATHQSPTDCCERLVKSCMSAFCLPRVLPRRQRSGAARNVHDEQKKQVSLHVRHTPYTTLSTLPTTVGGMRIASPANVSLAPLVKCPLFSSGLTFRCPTPAMRSICTSLLCLTPPLLPNLSGVGVLATFASDCKER